MCEMCILFFMAFCIPKAGFYANLNIITFYSQKVC